MVIHGIYTDEWYLIIPDYTIIIRFIFTMMVIILINGHDTLIKPILHNSSSIIHIYMVINGNENGVIYGN